ncbi:MAG: type III pantothenate kinase [Chloroflexota bacterium]|nr:type III pantothenate kinase [Chloroflexota bacterium]
MTLLAVDIGNTTIQAGIFDDGALGPSWRLATDHDRLADEYGILLSSLLRSADLTPEDVDGAVVACVVPILLPVFQAVCRRFFDVEPVVVGSTIRTGMRIRYEQPNEVGADRIVDAIAARDRHGPPPLIIVDFGTATVFDAIDADGDYLGGAIAPGVGIAAEALFKRASRLARVELERTANASGRRETEWAEGGILFGYVGLVEGIIARFKAELGGGRVVGTGGWADRIARETQSVDVVDQDLSLWGLLRVYQLNAEGTP